MFSNSEDEWNKDVGRADREGKSDAMSCCIPPRAQEQQYLDYNNEKPSSLTTRATEAMSQLETL